MGKNSGISWTHHTFNPWWGCEKLTEGCAHCYAEGVDRRFGGSHWGKDSQRRFFGDDHWSEPLKWNEAARKAGERHRVFCASMGDVFEDREDLDEWRERLWALIEVTPNLDWLLLTKRPENAIQMAKWQDGDWPENVWVGVTVENQRNAWRVGELIKIPCSIRFISCEPLLGPVDLSAYWKSGDASNWVDWVIVGGESGQSARRMEREWMMDLFEQCGISNTPFFFKQWGSFDQDGKKGTAKANGCLIDGQTIQNIPGEYR